MIELYQHQKIALSYLRTNDYFALFMEQGTGKTLVTLWHLRDLFKSGAIDSALIVAPKSALGAWERDIEKFDLADQILLKRGIILVNYEKVWRGDKKSPFFRSFGAIILDEAHKIKSRTSRRSKFLLTIATMAKYRYILTGTPISNGKLEDIWSEYCFLNPYLVRGYPYSTIFQGSYKDFEDKYCILNMYHKPSSYIRVNELQDIINQYSYRVKKADCLDLPEKLPDDVIKCDLLERSLYKRLVTESALLEYEILADNPLSRLVKLRQLSSGFLTYVDAKDGTKKTLELKSEKLEILDDLLDGYPDDKKIAIFAEFKHSVGAICGLLKKKKISYVVLDGDQKDKTIWRRFQEDKKIRVIVCQYQTANAGIDLYESDTIIFYEPTLVSNILEQSRDRIHRKGQVNKCSYIHLLTKGTVEVDIYNTVAGYSDFSDKLFTQYMSGYRRTYNQ